MKTQLTHVFEEFLKGNSQASKKIDMLSFEKGYFSDLIQVVANSINQSDLQYLAIIQMCNFFKQFHSSIFEQENVSPLHIMQLGISLCRQRTSKKWRDLMVFITRKMGVNWFSFTSLTLSTENVQNVMTMIDGVLEGIIMGKVEGYSNFLRQFYPYLKNWMQQFDRLQYKYCILNTFNKMGLVKNIGNFAEQWITIYKQNYKTIVLSSAQELEIGAKVKYVCLKFFSNFMCLLTQDIYYRCKGTIKEILKLVIRSLKKQQNRLISKKQEISLISLMRIHCQALIKPHLPAIKSILIPYMKYQFYQNEEVHVSPVQYIRKKQDVEIEKSIRTRSIQLWVKMCSDEALMKNSNSYSSMFDIKYVGEQLLIKKMIKFIVLDLLFGSQKIDDHILGLELLTKIKREVKSVSDSFKRNISLILKVGVLSKLSINNQLLNAHIFIVLAKYSQVFQTISLKYFHINSIQYYLFSKEMSYSKYMLYLHLVDISKNKQIKEIIDNNMQQIIKNYFDLILSLKSHYISNNFRDFLYHFATKQLKDQVFIYCLQLKDDFQQAILQNIVELRKMGEQWKFNANARPHILNYFDHHESSLSYSLVQIYLFDQPTIQKQDWIFYYEILNKYSNQYQEQVTSIQQIIYILRIYISKGGQRILDNIQPLFKFIANLLKHHYNMHINYIGCLLLPIYLIQNLHTCLHPQILQILWDVVFPTLQQLQCVSIEQEQYFVIEQYCCELMCLLIWQNRQFSEEVFQREGNFHKIMNRLLQYEGRSQLSKVNEKRIILGFCTILTFNFTFPAIEASQQFEQQSYKMQLLLRIESHYQNMLQTITMKGKCMKNSQTKVNTSIISSQQLYHNSDDSDVEEFFDDSSFDVYDREKYNQFYTSDVFQSVDPAQYMEYCFHRIQQHQVRQHAQRVLQSFQLSSWI